MEREITIQTLGQLVDALNDSDAPNYVWLGSTHDDYCGVSMYFGPASQTRELSIRWGRGNYGSRRENPGARVIAVEVALFVDNEIQPLGGWDDVLGWQTFDDIAALAQALAEGYGAVVVA